MLAAALRNCAGCGGTRSSIGMHTQVAAAAAARQFGAQIDDGREARGLARQRNAPEPDAVADGDRLRFVPRPRSRIDEGARQIGRKQKTRRQTHASISVLLESLRSKDGVVGGDERQRHGGHSSHSPAPPIHNASAASRLPPIR